MYGSVSIRKENKAVSIGLIERKLRFEFSTSFPCLSSVAMVLACLMSDCLCLSDVCLSVCPDKGFLCSVCIEQNRKHHTRKSGHTLQKS